MTTLAHRVAAAHGGDGRLRRSERRCERVVREAMDALREQLPDERAYMPRCDEDALVRLGMKRAVVAPVVRSVPGPGELVVSKS